MRLNSGITSIMYESTHRIMASLDDLEAALGAEQPVVFAKELTKTFETFFNGTVAELKQFLTNDPTKQRGEIVLMLPGKAKQSDDIPEDARRMLGLLEAEMPLKKACGVVAEYFGLRKTHFIKQLLTKKTNSLLHRRARSGILRAESAEIIAACNENAQGEESPGSTGQGAS